MLAAVLFALQTNKPFAASAHVSAESIGHDSSNEIETIAIVEEDLQKQGTSLIEELHRQRDLYLSELSDASSDRQANIVMILDTLDKAIVSFEQNSAQNSLNDTQNDSNSAISAVTAPFHISPKCECNWLNVLLNVACDYCSAHSDVVAIATGFSARGWSLAADLMLFNLSNTNLDVHYWPSKGDRVANSSHIRGEKVAFSDQIIDEVQDTVGWANNFFGNTLDGDVYNSLGLFWYSKTYVNNENVGNAFRIRTCKSGYTKYLNMGPLMGSDSNFRYVTSGNDSNDLWVFEMV